MGVLDAAKKLNKEFKDDNLGIISDIVPEYERLGCGAFGMDYPLFGGLPYGRICTYSGKNHSGKTTAACCELAAYQRANPDKTCVFVDVEHSLDLKHQAKMNGLQLDKLLYVNPTTLSGEQILDYVSELQKEPDIGMIVIDSIPALVPAISMDNDMTKDPGMRGTIAKTLHRFLTQMSSRIAEKNNILILINQVRISGTTFTGAPIYSEPGGDAPKYYSSVAVRFGTRTFTQGDNMDCCKPDGDGADGFRLKFQITKNKTAPCNRGGGFITYRYASGLDWMHDLLEIATTFDFIHRVNNVTYELVNLDTGEVYADENGELLRGKKADLVDYIMTHKAFRDEYVDMLNRKISGGDKTYGTLLDEDTAKEIAQEEAAVKENQ